MSYTTVDKLNTIRVLCHKVLPAVYDESLSYLEQICKLAYKVNETIDSVNALNDNVDALNDIVTDFGTRLTTVEEEISSFETEIRENFETLEATINANVDSKLAEVDTKIEDMESEFSAFETTITNRVDYLETHLTQIINDELAYLNQMYATLADDLRAYVVDKVNEAISNIPDLTNIYVVDPTSGNMVKVQEAILNSFYYGLGEALTIDEFNAIGLTVNELNDLMVDSIPSGFSIKQWLTKARTWLVKQISAVRIDFLSYPHSIVRDYLAGTKVWHDRNVDINQMLIQIAGSYSCGELNVSNITVGEIQTANITCQEYALQANMKL